MDELGRGQVGWACCGRIGVRWHALYARCNRPRIEAGIPRSCHSIIVRRHLTDTHTQPQARIQSDIEALCRFPRSPASDGEREAARSVASRFQEIGLEPELETFHFYPEYWNVWGAHMLGALSARLLLGRGGRRRGLLGAAATSPLVVSFWGGAAARFHWLRRLFPARPSINVLARLRNPQAPRLLVVSAHVDAARSGFTFHPALPMWGRREMPPALILPFWALLSLAGASALRAIGLPRRLAKLVAMPGAILSAATVGFMADIRRNPVVPGANDDASAVGTVLALAQDLAAGPPTNLEVWSVVTGCEEGIMGGMYAFLERHHAELEERRPNARSFGRCRDVVAVRANQGLTGEELGKRRGLSRPAHTTATQSAGS
jgi:Peptidase family M28